MKHILLGCIFFQALVSLAGCGIGARGPQSSGKEPEIFTALTWNAQALFDGHEGGNEYGEYRESSGWNGEKYAARITAISRAILGTVQNGNDRTGVAVPSFIGLAEVENASVLENLAGGELSKHGYSWTAFGNIPGAPLGVGVISRHPLTDIRVHSITAGKETAPRPMLEVRVEPQGKPLVFFICHWKSKLGGEDATGVLRRSSARLALRRLWEITETEPETPVIIMGDLNENHDEFYRRSGKILSALLPDDPAAAERAALLGGSPQDFLVLSGEKPPRARCFPQGIEALYSPWGRELTGGSYYYKNAWETIDHILLSKALFDQRGWEFDGCRTLSHPPFTTPGGSPDAYRSRSGRGLSDHLPLLLSLRCLEAED